jgi:predicted phosphoribosyltransferase
MVSAFIDRAHAGQALAQRLMIYAHRPDTLVLALPRGGVTIGFEIARALALPLDILVVRKLGVPGHEELAMGAIASGGIRVLNPGVIRDLGIPASVLESETQRQLREVERREFLYRGNRPPHPVRGKTVLLVDDGLATGSTMRAAIASLRKREPSRIIAAVPVGSPEACEQIGKEADGCICLLEPDSLQAIGLWYEDFSQVEDSQVRQMLDQLAQLEECAEETPIAATSARTVVS